MYAGINNLLNNVENNPHQAFFFACDLMTLEAWRGLTRNKMLTPVVA
jgi:hypothetical protein